MVQVDSDFGALAIEIDDAEFRKVSNRADRIVGSIDDALVLGFRSATARRPDPAEVAILRDLHATTLERFQASPDDASALVAAARVAAPEGVARMKEAHPDVPIVTAAVDEKLNEVGYIVPGLGDAGDRLFGTK